MHLRFGDAERGRAEVQALADAAETPRTWRDRCLDALADDALTRGDADAAAAGYRSLAARILDEDFARMEDVKIAAATDADARGPVAALLIGATHRGGDYSVAASLLGAWEERSRSPLASFLLGKNLSQRGYRRERGGPSRSCHRRG